MPFNPANASPGVYVYEIPSGVRTITGVATSITAFIGRAWIGPVDEPITISNFSDFERVFGGLRVNYPMSYAVRDFFLNGGSQAIIVRLFKPSAAGKGRAALTVGNLKLEALSPGTAGNDLRVIVDNNGITDEVAQRYSMPKDKLFNLTIIYDSPTGSIEEHINTVSIADGPRRVDRVLDQASQFIRVRRKADGTPDLPADETPPSPTPDPEPGSTEKKGIKATATEQGEDSQPLTVDTDFPGSPADKTGLYALDKTDLFNLLCIPADQRNGDTPLTVYQNALSYCVKRRAMLIVDSPTAWSTDKTFLSKPSPKLTELGLNGTNARNTAIFFPRVIQADPKREGQPDTFVPCGILAGVMARTDTQRGVWKAPAGLDAGLTGTQGLEVSLTDDENGRLNSLGINCLRSFPVVGRVVWGARTLRGADLLADEYKYIPVRRTALYIEESLYRGTQWVVFEPNDEPLWAQIRLNVGAFMHNLFVKGAFQGKTPREAYFVKCDKETTTQNDIDLGIVNIVVGFAPLKPAEFVVIQIQQIAGQIQV